VRAFDATQDLPESKSDRAGPRIQHGATGLDRATATLIRITGPMSKYASVTGSLLVLAMAFLILADVIARHAFNRPFMATIELEQFMLACSVYLSLAWAMLHGDHVQVDLMISRLPKKGTALLELVFSIFSLFLCIVLAWQLWSKARESFALGESGYVTGIPIAGVLGVTIAGCVLLLLALLRSFLIHQSEVFEKWGRPWLVSCAAYAAALLLILLPWALRRFGGSYPPSVVGIVGVILLLALMLLGFRIAFAMAFIGFLGVWLLDSPQTALAVVKMKAYESVADYFLCVVPFFVLMGMLCFHSGLSRAAYDAAYHWLGPLPGGVAISTVAGCGCFAAICGDSMATAATMGSVSLPEMKKFRYDDSLATGALAAGGTLGILIPPSIGFIVYGLIAEVSVAKLFIAGILPGVVMVCLFAAMILIRCRLNPSLGPSAAHVTWSARFASLKGFWPIAVLFLLVIGGIYAGYITPTEAGAVGAIGALAIGLFRGKALTWKGFLGAIEATMRMSAMIFFILIGVNILGFFTVKTEIPLHLSSFIADLEVSRYVILLFILALYLLLGMVMNIIPMIMLTLPIIFPTIQALGFDPLWFGVVTVIMMEMGQITPPVGINVFVISGVAKDVPMVKIFRGILPFLLVQVLVILLLLLFPSLATYLPGFMKTLPSIGG